MFDSLWNEINRNLIAEDRWLYLLKGLGVTLQISFFAIILGSIIGVVIAFMKMSNTKVFGCRIFDKIASIYVTIIRGTPLVTQLLIIYFVIFASVDIDKVIVAIIAFGLNSGAYVSEIIRAGILAVDKGQMEAGRSLGFNYAKTMIYIIMPQAIKNIIPTLANEFIVLIKETAIVGYIALEDLTKVGDVIRSRTYSALVPLVTVAIVYLLVTGLLAKIFALIERRLRIGDTR
ncbi:MAG: amino acid transporter permease [Clostridiales bacterium]|jgi:His/Glu/Gln/Arg/opine family amino acid ABC transporter permease subunit|nr:amino acid transporter permease [Clostridiales bacterium]